MAVNWKTNNVQERTSGISSDNANGTFTKKRTVFAAEWAGIVLTKQWRNEGLTKNMKIYVQKSKAKSVALERDRADSYSGFRID